MYVEDVKHKPTKLFVSTLVDSLSEEEAYEEGIKKVEEFVSLINVFLKRGFRILKYEVSTLPVPNVRSLEEVELHVDNGYVTKIITPYGSWTILPPHFGEVNHAEIFPLHFEMPKIEGKVSPKVIVMPRKELRQVEDFFSRIDSFDGEKRGLLKIIGQLYATAVSTETISVSYLLLWQILEVYAKTLSRLGMLRKPIKTEVISMTVNKNIFPEKSLDEIKRTIINLRETRNTITHPEIFKDVNNLRLLDHYMQLKGIVDKILISLSKSKI